MFRCCAPAALALVATGLSTGGCLLAYDFEEYGAGGGGATSSAASSSSGGPSCAEQRIFVLPDDWFDVRVGRRGASFVAAPREELAYVRLEEGAPLSPPEPRASATARLEAMFSLDVGELDQIFGVAQSDADVKVAGFTVGDPADTIPSRTLEHAQQISRDYASLLVSFEIEEFDAHAAELLLVLWDAEAGEPLPLALGPPLATCLLGDCEFVSASVDVKGDGISETVVIGNGLRPEAVAIETPVGRGAFAIAYGVAGDETTVEVYPLESFLDSAAGVDASRSWIVGRKGDRHASVNIGTSQVVTLGVAFEDTRSAVSGRFWMNTERGEDGRPVARVVNVGGGPPVLELRGAVAASVATAPRSNAAAEGVLLAAVVGAEEIVLGGCRLPPGRSVLLETNVDVP